MCVASRSPLPLSWSTLSQRLIEHPRDKTDHLHLVPREQIIPPAASYRHTLCGSLLFCLDPAQPASKGLLVFMLLLQRLWADPGDPGPPRWPRVGSRGLRASVSGAPPAPDHLKAQPAIPSQHNQPRFATFGPRRPRAKGMRRSSTTDPRAHPSPFNGAPRGRKTWYHEEEEGRGGGKTRLRKMVRLSVRIPSNPARLSRWRIK